MNENQVMDPKFLTYKQAAEVVNLNPNTLRKMVCADAGIPYYRIGPRTVRFEKRELIKWVQSRRRGEKNS